MPAQQTVTIHGSLYPEIYLSVWTVNHIHADSLGDIQIAIGDTNVFLREDQARKLHEKLGRALTKLQEGVITEHGSN